MQLSESSIYITLKQLRRMLRRLKFRMNKCDRPDYDSTVMFETAMCMRYFILAFQVKDKKYDYLTEMIGWFAVLREDMEYYVTENIIHFASKRDKVTGEIIGESTQKLELFKMVAKIDEDVSKWWSSLNKGRNLADNAG